LIFTKNGQLSRQSNREKIPAVGVGKHFAKENKEMKKKALSIPVIFLMSIFIMAVSSTSATGQGKAVTPKGEAVVVIRTGTFQMQKAFDPHTVSGMNITPVTTLIFDKLITKDANGSFQPALAESWEIAKDWSSMSFKLRKGVKFHNGDPFTAEDVKFSIERAMRDDFRFLYGPELKRNITKIEILDAYNLRLHLKSPYPAFLDRCYFVLAIVPKNYVEKVGDDGFAAKPVGVGPFRVVKFERDISLDMEAVENHYRKTPYVKKLRFLTLTEPATRLAMIKTGEADFVMAHEAHIPLLQKDPNIRVVMSKNSFVLTLVFQDMAHPEDSPFKNPLVRKATSLAIDRKGIADAMGNGTLEPWGSFLAPYHPGFDPKRNKPDPYNPAEAKRLLAKAGYPNGFDTVLTFTEAYGKERFEAMQQQLQGVGIRCKLNMLEHGTWSAMFVGAKLRGIGLGTGPWWQGIGHPVPALSGHITGAWSHKLATPEILKAMDKVDRAIGTKEIGEAARKLDDTILESTIRVPLWSVHTPYAVRKKVEEYPGVVGVVYPLGFEYLKVSGR
jgi:peptide/nickel transport system substrate-binding protein